MDSSSEWDVRSLPSDFSLSLPSSPGHGPLDSHGVPGTPLSLHSVPDSAFSLSPNSASNVFLPPPMDDRERDRHGALETSRTLVLPSLPWPHLSSPYGETIGEMKLLVVSRASAGDMRQRVRTMLLEENSDVLRVYAPETLPDGTRTTWADTMMRMGGSEDGTKNICITETLGYDEHGDVNDTIRTVLHTVYEPFRRIQPMLNPMAPSTSQLVDLLASPGSHLYLACIFLLPHECTPLEQTLFRVLQATMPIVVLEIGDAPGSNPASSSSPNRRQLAPTHTLPELAHSLFRSPQHRDRLRREAATGFLSWWSAERESLQREVRSAESDNSSHQARESASAGTTSSGSFRALPLPILDPLHSSMLCSPYTLLPPLFHQMARVARAAVDRDSWSCASCAEEVEEPTAPVAENEKKFSVEARRPPMGGGSDWSGSSWTWDRIVRGVAGFAAMTAIWAGLVWATSV